VEYLQECMYIYLSIYIYIYVFIYRYGYPLYAASHVALNTVRLWLEDKNNLDSVDLVY
jgi:hypothetical protein